MPDVDIRFRLAQAADLPELHALVERAYRGDESRAGWTTEADLVSGPRTTREELHAILRNTHERLVLAEEGITIVGCVQLSERVNRTTYLGLLTVEPRRQADGLGKRLLAAAESEAQRSFGAETVELTVIAQRTELMAYYERRGFVRTGERRPFPIAMVPPLELVVLAKPIHTNAAR